MEPCYEPIFLSVDPHASNYPGNSPYHYVLNNPINAIDPDGRDVILLVWPDYKANGYPGTGHASVLIINNETGETHYFEFGRYDEDNFGDVNTYSTTNVEIGEDGLPTDESLSSLLGDITTESGRGHALLGAYFETDNIDDMLSYVDGFMNNQNRNAYSTLSKNCGTFCVNVMNQDQSIKNRSPNWVAPNPSLMIHQYTRRADHTVIRTPNGNFQFNRKRNK